MIKYINNPLTVKLFQLTKHLIIKLINDEVILLIN